MTKKNKNQRQARGASYMWKRIARMNWEASHDYDRIGREIFSKWTRSQIKTTKEFVGERVNELYAAMKRWEQDHRPMDIGSNDGLSDVLYHVVGLGEQEFKKTMEDPTLLESRYNEGQYKESFAYCFQNPVPIKSHLPSILSAIDSAKEMIQQMENELGTISANVENISQSLKTTWQRIDAIKQAYNEEQKKNKSI